MTPLAAPERRRASEALLGDVVERLRAPRPPADRGLTRTPGRARLAARCSLTLLPALALGPAARRPRRSRSPSRAAGTWPRATAATPGRSPTRPARRQRELRLLPGRGLPGPPRPATRRFARHPGEPGVVREQHRGRWAAGTLVAHGRRRLRDGGRRAAAFAPPVIWLLQRGRRGDRRRERRAPGRAAAVAAAQDGTRVRWIIGRGRPLPAGLGGHDRRVGRDPDAGRLPRAPGLGLAALGPGVVAWVDRRSRRRARRCGSACPRPRGALGAVLPGPGPCSGSGPPAARSLVAVRVAGGVLLARYDLPKRRTRCVVWSGSRLRLDVAGRRPVAIDGGAPDPGRPRGPRARCGRSARATAPVDAVGVDGARLAVDRAGGRREGRAHERPPPGEDPVRRLRRLLAVALAAGGSPRRRRGRRRPDRGAPGRQPGQRDRRAGAREPGARRAGRDRREGHPRRRALAARWRPPARPNPRNPGRSRLRLEPLRRRSCAASAARGHLDDHRLLPDAPPGPRPATAGASAAPRAGRRRARFAGAMARRYSGTFARPRRRGAARGAPDRGLERAQPARLLAAAVPPDGGQGGARCRRAPTPPCSRPPTARSTRPTRAPRSSAGSPARRGGRPRSARRTATGGVGSLDFARWVADEGAADRRLEPAPLPAREPAPGLLRPLLEHPSAGHPAGG